MIQINDPKPIAPTTVNPTENTTALVPTANVPSDIMSTVWLELDMDTDGMDGQNLNTDRRNKLAFTSRNTKSNDYIYQQHDKYVYSAENNKTITNSIRNVLHQLHNYYKF